MIRKTVFATAVLFITVFPCFAGSTPTAIKDDERLRVPASETEQLRVLLANQKVEAVLTDGTRVKGRVREVRGGSILINVDSSEGASALPRGEQTVATERFNTLEMRSYKGKKKGIFAAIGGAVGLLLGAAVLASEIDSLGGEGSINGAGAAVWVATTAGGTAAGYALGRQLDKKRVTIVIVK